jgi:HAD superfamily hydrolase (TIGR01509 family)
MARRPRAAKSQGSDILSLLSAKKAFLFDLDGTLVDSSPLHERAYVETIQANGLEVAFCYEHAKGRSTQDYLAVILAPEDLPRLQALAAEKQSRYRDLIADLQPLPGADRILAFLKSEGKRLYVVTGGSRRSSNHALAAVGLAGYFEGMTAADDVARSKPEPDPYLHALHSVGFPSSEAIAVEDAENGVLSCRAANLDVILVNNQEAGRRIQPYFSDLDSLLEALRCGISAQ